jgi:type II secretory pathway pseudopilin PulG
VVGLAIVAVMAAVLIPALHSHIEDARINKIASDLTSIADAIREYDKHMGTYPIDLSQLVTKPVAQTDANSCGVKLTAAEVVLWRGPYLPSAAPYLEGEDTIFAALSRKASTTKDADILQILVRQPSKSTVNELDSLFDRDTDLNAGTITWSSTSPARMIFGIPIQSC